MTVEKLDLTNEGASLTAYIQDPSEELPNFEKRPAMLVIPGGGYNFCSDREGEPVALAFMAMGFNAFVLRYSIKENAAFPAPLNDAQEALETIRKNSEKWHIDNSKVAAVGFSAGGHLCAALSAMGRVKPNASVLVYPCILESIGRILAKPIPSVEKYVDETTPPTFIVASREDTCVPIENSLRYADALEKAGVDFEMHIFSKGYHGFSLADSTVFSRVEDVEYNKHLACWTALCETWLKKVFDF